MNDESKDGDVKDSDKGVNNGRWFVLVAVGVGTFMSALDGSVVNTVLPVIRRSFQTNVATVQWIVTIYLLVVSGLLLSFGRLGDMRGNKRVYVAGFGVFVASSAFCGLAPSPLALIAGRAVQAIGAAMLFANSAAILTKNFPPERRGQALGMLATMTYLGLIVGPPVGGWLAGLFSWRAVFYINVPIGAMAMALSQVCIPQDALGESAERFDIAGAVTFMLGLVALLFALNQGHGWGWGSPRILGLLTLAIVLLGVFLAVESSVGSPMLDLSLFRRRVFSAAATSAVLNYIAVYSIVFLLPFYLIQERGLSPGRAGVMFSIQAVVMATIAPLSGTLSDRIGSRLPATLGMTILAAGLVLMSRLSSTSPLAYVGLALAACGLGTGIFISPNNSALMGSAPRHRQGIAAGVMAEARNVGMVLGVGLAGAIFTTILARGHGPGASGALVTAIDAGFLAAAGVAALGAAVSWFTQAAAAPVPQPGRPGHAPEVAG